LANVTKMPYSGGVYTWKDADGTVGEIPSAVQAYYDRKLLERARPKLIALDFAQKRPLPSQNSPTIKFRKYNDLSRTVANLVLTEGTPGNGEQMSVTDKTVTVKQYGNYITITDMVQLTVEDAVLNEGIDLLAEQMADTIDTLVFTTLAAASNVRLANAASSIGTLASAITSGDLDYAIRMLRRNNAQPFTEMIRATTGFNTFPIRPAYFAFVHPDVAKDLENINGFISVERYASQGPVHDAEIGAYKNIRFLMTTQAPILDDAGNPNASTTWVPGETNTSKAAVYHTIVVAKNAYGVVEVERGTSKSIIKTPGSQDTSNPLNQFSTAGWKMLFASTILEDAYMIDIKSLASL